MSVNNPTVLKEADLSKTRVPEIDETIRSLKGKLVGFDQALVALKYGYMAAREGSASRLYLVDGSRFGVNRAPLSNHFPMGMQIEYKPHIDVFEGANRLGEPPVCRYWSPSQEDILANDWKIIVD